MKTCFKCGVEKDLDDFYRHGMMADGRLNKCKECTKQDVRANREKNREYYRQYDRGRGSRQTAEYQSGYRSRKPRAYWARCAVSNAIRDGKIKPRKTCEACGWRGRLHAHHDDYARPLDVLWLCPACHKDWHMKNGPGKNGE